MKMEEIKEALTAAGVKDRAYDFDSTGRDEAYCMDDVSHGWVVYYRERGIHRDERLFASKKDACRHVLDLLLRDPTTRM